MDENQVILVYEEGDVSVLVSPEVQAEIIHTASEVGPAGARGLTGDTGKSAYDEWLELGNTGSVEDFLNSLKGEDGKSAYQTWLDLGNVGSELVFINSLKGLSGLNGKDGADGKSAYQTWLDNGNTGTEFDFLNSLKGEDGLAGRNGLDGLSAYQIWLNQGNIGTETDFLSSLKATCNDCKSDTDITYSRDEPTGVTVGGLPSGTILGDTNLVDVLDQILFPYAKPSFTSFKSNIINILEVGNEIRSGYYSFTWNTANSSNLKSNSIIITDYTRDSILGSNLINDSSENLYINSIKYTASTQHKFRIQATSIRNEVITKDININWQYRIFYGESALDMLNESQIESLRVNELSSTASKTYNMLAGGYKWICYPTSFGLRTVFKDLNTNFDVAMNPPSIISITNSFNVTVDYYCHRTYNVLGGSISIGVS